MLIEFDPVKSAKNLAERGLPFERVADFDFSGAIMTEDDRKAYPEVRYVAAGFVGQRLHVVCFTPIHDGIRVISFRKANNREVKAYEQAQDTD